MKVFVPLALLIALCACGDVSSQAVPSAEQPLATQRQGMYRGRLAVVDDGELSCPTITDAIQQGIGDYQEIRCLKDVWNAINVGDQQDTRALFVEYDLWSRDGRTVYDLIAHYRNSTDPYIKDRAIYVFSVDPSVESDVLAAGATGFLLMPHLPNQDTVTKFSAFIDVANYWVNVYELPDP